ncbi:MAG: YciI family protein [Paracoccus sp. (in: a-proteobacteria)]|uniref:YciI family protein n=1 Tax=Paracoccus sp. TaxID=267 RepID=UPI0026DF171C|nr:YciI family protein [Paracoccus sp. (in: a-proteobacteria)]MDO5622695.1 YciI family protein [Paracoccus sp. (in: a-proteobacteria)]
MRFISISRPLNDAGMDQFAPYLDAEVRYGWQNYKDGTFRDIYFRQDVLGVVIMLDADDQAAAEAAVAGFPLAKAGLIAFDTIPVGPFTNWEMLFASA